MRRVPCRRKAHGKTIAWWVDASDTALLTLKWHRSRIALWDAQTAFSRSLFSQLRDLALSGIAEDGRLPTRIAGPGWKPHKLSNGNGMQLHERFADIYGTFNKGIQQAISRAWAASSMITRSKVVSFSWRVRAPVRVVRITAASLITSATACCCLCRSSLPRLRSSRRMSPRVRLSFAFRSLLFKTCGKDSFHNEKTQKKWRSNAHECYIPSSLYALRWRAHYCPLS